jgi:hypothetical protein
MQHASLAQLLAFLYLFGSCASALRVFNVTSIQSLTGSLAYKGREVYNATLFFNAWFQTHAGGVVRARDGSNWTIAVKLLDDQSDPAVLAQLTAQALADPALGAIMGPDPIMAEASAALCEAAATLNFQVTGHSGTYKQNRVYLFGPAGSSDSVRSCIGEKLDDEIDLNVHVS